jgi:hypothetical protein
MLHVCKLFFVDIKVADGTFRINDKAPKVKGWRSFKVVMEAKLQDV